MDLKTFLNQSLLEQRMVHEAAITRINLMLSAINDTEAVDPTVEEDIHGGEQQSGCTDDPESHSKNFIIDLRTFQEPELWTCSLCGRRYNGRVLQAPDKKES